MNNMKQYLQNVLKKLLILFIKIFISALIIVLHSD